MKKKFTQRVTIIFIVVFILLLTYEIRILGRHNEVIYTILGKSVYAMHVCSVLTVFRLLFMILVVMLKGKSGLIISELFLFEEGIRMIINLGVHYESALLAAQGNNILGMIVLFLIYFYIKRQKMMLELDELTKLPNKRTLHQYIDGLINDKTPFCMMIVNIDDFKCVNDLMGHEYGDKLLVELVQRWKSFCEDELADSHGFLARVGGDEFVHVRPNPKQNIALKNNLHNWEKMMSEGVCFDVEGKETYLSASMGVAFFPNDGVEFEQIFRCADLALRTAKESGMHYVKYYDSSMSEKLTEYVNMEKELRIALATDGLFLNYQPQFHVENKDLRGVETLVRMHDSKGNVVSPGLFIPVAETTGLIVNVDLWVFRRAMEDLKEVAKKCPNFLLSVNASVYTLFSQNFIPTLKKMVSETGFPIHSLEIEVTESLFMQSFERAKTIVDELKEMGIHIALDDFGTGYSSLSYLRELPYDTLKIDKKFVDQIDKEEHTADSNLVEGIVSMGHLMGMKIVAEGVETQNQLEQLQQFGCDFIQGYLWSKPISLSMLQARFKRYFS